jgi:D-alanine--poly(phosphoribitol) ligase subunit 2
MDENIIKNSERILGVIYAAIDALNDSLPKERRVEKSPEAHLFDSSGVVDSLGLTLLIVGLEQKIEEELGVRVTLVNDEVMSKETSPFQNVGTLTKYISKLVAEQDG